MKENIVELLKDIHIDLKNIITVKYLYHILYIVGLSINNIKGTI